MMDDDNEVTYMRRTKSLHYGSLEEQEKRRQAGGGKSTSGSMAADAIQAGIAAGNINIGGGKAVEEAEEDYYSCQNNLL